MLDLILSHGESMAQPLSVFRGNQVCTHLRALSSQPGVFSVAHEGKEPGLASQHDGKRELESLGPEAHMFPARSTISKRIPCSALCLLPWELLGLKFCPTVVWLPPSCSPHSSPFSRLHQLSFFSPPPSLLLLFPPTLLYANPADAHYLPSPRASATTGYVWCPAPGLGPSPGVPRLYSTPRRVGRTYGSLMGAPVTCVRWSLWHILAWVSRGPWE